MGKLKTLINSLSKEEIRTFKLYSERVKTAEGEGKKLVRLFDKIKNENYDDNDEKLVSHFYNGNKNAFYRLKNRLSEDIEKSLLMLHSDMDKQTKVTNNINLAKIFLIKSSYDLAFSHLLKAEKIAIEEKYSNLLKLIYSEIINICSSYSEIDPEIYIRKLEEIEKEEFHIQDLNNVAATVNYKLKRSNFEGRNTNIVEELETLLAGIVKDEKVLDNPIYKVKINEIVRNMLLQKKDFTSLEIYLKSSIEEFESKKWFRKENHHHKIIWYSWLINTLSKRKKFEEALQYSNKLLQALKQFNRILYAKYIWTYYQSLVINYTYYGDSTKAIEVLEEIASSERNKGEPFYDVFVYLNLTSLYFCEGDLSKSLKSLLNILIKDVFKKLPLNVRLNVSIVEVIIHLEKENNAFVISRIEEIRKKYKMLLKEESYKREQLFLKILKDMVNIPNCFSAPRFKRKFDMFISESKNTEVGSNEAINYLAYLYSKNNKSDYYEELLKLVN